MKSELKQRIIDFLGELDHLENGEEEEAKELYRLLTRNPGRQKGTKVKKKANVSKELENALTFLLDKPKNT